MPNWTNLHSVADNPIPADNQQMLQNSSPCKLTHEVRSPSQKKKKKKKKKKSINQNAGFHTVKPSQLVEKDVRSHRETCRTQNSDKKLQKKARFYSFNGVLHLWALFLKTLCIYSKNKANFDKVSYGSGQKCSKKLKNHSFTSVEAIVRKLQRKMCENQYFPCFEP